VIAKDVILVLDVSGSMRGTKIEQAKAALDFVLDNLGYSWDHPRCGQPPRLFRVCILVTG